MSGLRMVQLRSLQVDSGGCMMVAVIIAKSQAHVFKKGAESRGVFSFTIRDSPLDTANCSAWGSPNFVLSLDQMFHVGDVVDILSPQIKSRQLEDQSEQYQPQVSSPFRIILNERQSEITIHEAENYIDFMRLIHIPTKLSAGYFTLSDIINNSQDIREDSVDILVAVQVVFPTRNIKTKAGKEIQNREITVMDQSTTNPLKILLWEPETIKRASSWQSRETILFISDIKLEWNNFTKCIVGRVFGRTVITEDPHTAEAETLRVYSRHAPISRNAVIDQVSQNFPDPNSIRTVMTIQQVLDKVNTESNEQFTALLYVVVTKLDLDGCNKITIAKCSKCLSVLKEPQSTCNNIYCLTTLGNEINEPEISFNIFVTLTDHTGSLPNCKLTGKIAEKVLGCELKEFLSMDVQKKGQIKWQFLLERCAVRIVVMKGPLVSILSCSVVDPNEVVNKLPVY